MPSQLSIRGLIAVIGWPLLVFEAWMALAIIVLLDPLLVSLLTAMIAVGGYPFVGNTALVGFLLSPVGVTTLLAALGATIFLTAVEFGGVSLIAWEGLHGRRLGVMPLCRRLLPRLPALLALTAIILGVIALLIAPVAIAAFAAKAYWLSGGDIYFYLVTHPPELWYALASIGLVGIAMTLLAFWLLLRWCLSVSICVLEPVSAIEALRLSAQATRGHKRALSLMIAGWAIAALAASVIVALVLTGLDDVVQWLRPSLNGLRIAALVLALIDAVVLALLGCFARAALAVLAMRVYARLPDRPRVEAAPAALAPQSPWARIAAALILIALPAASIGHSAWSIGHLDLSKPVAVTAHRAGAAHAPENTIAALRRAIADGADYVEIDVQETKDGEVVLLHDTDLRRVAGLAQSIWDVAYADMRDLDAGSWFDPSFASERIPSLRDFAAAAKGRIKLNIELKVNGHDQDLARRVIAVLNEVGSTREAIISSLDIGILSQVREADAAIPVGFIVGAGVGRLARLNVDFCSIANRIATPAYVAQLGRGGRGVHVWGLGNRDAILSAILDGADNVIVDDPPVAIQTIRWFEELTPAEQALLRLRHALDLSELLPPSGAEMAEQD